jgi:clan AA aspartic protease
MIPGAVSNREARVRLAIHGPSGQELELDAVIDTGFTASLSLPSAVIAELDLDWLSMGRGILADGSECLFDVYDAIVNWDGSSKRVLVDEAETDPLIGMALLSGYELTIQVRAGGTVAIKRLT